MNNLKYLVILCVYLLGLSLTKAQTFNPPQMEDAGKVKPVVSYNHQCLSPMGAFLVNDLVSKKLSLKELMDKYPIMMIDEEAFVFAFVELSEDVNEDELKAFGVKKSQVEGCMLSVQIPLNKFIDFVQSDCCSYIDVGVKNTPTMDSARSQTNVNDAYNGIGLQSSYKGEGVVVGIIDIGFEYGHPNFYDSTGTTFRIKRVWEQETSGTPPSGFNYGRELSSQSAILAASCSEQTETHGTHVAGIAAGSGGNISPRKYRGMAPKSDIVLVATNSTTSGIYDGINYIYNYANSVNKPCVINMSWGSHYGPHDGTSSFDRACDSYTTLHPHGLILVGSAGNEGSDSLHLYKVFSYSDSLLYTILDFNGYSYGETTIDLWGSPNTVFSAGLGIVNMTTGNFEDGSYFYASSSNNYESITLTDSDNETLSATIVCYNADTYNNRPRISLVIDNTNQTSNNQRVCLAIKSTMTDTVHGWNNKGTFIDGGFSGSVTAGNTDCTVGELGGSGKSMISVGSYMSKQSWVDYNGLPWSMGGTEKGLSYFSSHGPTMDNRTKPDITAPGQEICSSINRYNTDYLTNYGGAFDVSQSTFNNHTEHYGIMQGTSMAAPATAGIIALWLEANHYLTINQVKTLLKNSAITDSLTGTIGTNGSNLWGWGKINALGGLNNTIIDTVTLTLTSNNTSWGSVTGAGSYPIGSNVTINAIPSTNYRFVSWSDGNTSATRNITLTTDSSLIATFAIKNFTVTALSNNEQYGTVSGSGVYDYLSQATLVATPKNNYYFVNWSDGDTSTTKTITVTSDTTLVATFAIKTFTVTATSNNDQYGTVSGSGVYEYLSNATLVATPFQNYEFIKWDNDITDNPYTLVVNGNKELVAIFAEKSSLNDVLTNDYKIINQKGYLGVIGNKAERLVIFNALGKVIVDEPITSGKLYLMPESGVYFVKIANRNAVKEVVIR